MRVVGISESSTINCSFRVMSKLKKCLITILKYNEIEVFFFFFFKDFCGKYFPSLFTTFTTVYTVFAFSINFLLPSTRTQNKTVKIV